MPLTADQARLLRLHLCSTHLRGTALFLNDEAEWESAMGMVIARALSMLSSNGWSRLTNKAIVESVNKYGFGQGNILREGAFGKFLDGQHSGTVSWSRVTLYALSYIFSGDDGVIAASKGTLSSHPADGDRKGTVEFFLGTGTTPKHRPDFFATKGRWRHDSPWNVTELVHHINWTTKAKQIADDGLLPHAGSFVLTFQADGTPFPHEDYAGMVVALQHAANAGVTLRFVFSRGSRAERSFDSLAASFQGNKASLVAQPATHGPNSWLHARTRYLHSSVDYPDIGPSLLEIANPIRADSTVTVPAPLTRRLGEGEQQLFEGWLAGLPAAPAIGGMAESGIAPAASSNIANTKSA